MLGFLSKIFGGSKSEKDVQKLSPVVEKTNQFFESYKSLSTDALRAKTLEFKNRIKEKLSETDDAIQSLKTKADALSESAIQEKDTLYQEIDQLRKKRDQQIEEALK